jgi:hypothetical protein
MNSPERRRVSLEAFVLRTGAATARRFMDKGILRFMAEAYLLLHSGAMLHAELPVESAGRACAKADSPQQARSRAVRDEKTSSQQAPEPAAKG